MFIMEIMLHCLVERLNAAVPMMKTLGAPL